MTQLNTEEHLQQLRAEFVPQGPFNATPFFAASAKGALIFDVKGRQLIDFAGGIGVMNVGHSHPKVVAAIKHQAEQFTHTCFHIVMYEPYLKLAQKLCALVPGSFDKMALFANSGAEAVENAIKIARHHTKRKGVIALENGFHGRTFMAMTLTSKVKPYKYGFGPLMSDVYRIPSAYCYRCSFGLTYPDCDAACANHLENFFISHVAAEETAALIAEPISGEGGFITPPPEYFKKISRICNDNGIVFIADEIQSGIGRTGTMLAMEHWDVTPDVTTLAKSLAGGMPLSAVVGKKQIMNSAQIGGLGGTYGGNPVCCAAALAVLDLFEEENLLEQSISLGQKLRNRFDTWKNQFELIGDVRGIGPMLALELVKNRETKIPAAQETKALVQFCYEKGLILLSCGNLGNVIRTLMPLTITNEELERGLAIMEEGLTFLSRQ
ncbi:MAG: 4-aminobutyrate--2-oxoglutarate transaminase [Proteobacteria bacterium]|nr:4-aminobutyrate--2-oxoglutarate transaminase [Pseudomonadota bacterium]MBU1581783.1 4-aminobutyrate--2-oxoglutarate transaminase [Pseudomonadota bacterium]MBU2453041.1 4-aminobutyrate--2-oxoglutarate transaminase [Pseudomonadota bacterium]MBU2627996.1 4-aminobutyrate--2-oxoglutarate transaminase [Pseudomonadota bacterium]